ncbi:hypothetical protein AQUCO_01800113v1 [Aquilegia coerulea]|uniref:Uncharacterized protein n=1 Tax=Aquilegia coerulea TaxID=218851 RepID=A0A2G5DK16_AQUCA|nr:hypothetical protein AQUCO_01800113v1 [Aquilegia coerulea]
MDSLFFSVLCKSMFPLTDHLNIGKTKIKLSLNLFVWELSILFGLSHTITSLAIHDENNNAILDMSHARMFLFLSYDGTFFSLKIFSQDGTIRLHYRRILS